MRKTLIVLAVIFTVLGIVFAFLPLGTFAIIPIGLALIFALAAFVKSEISEKKFPKWILIIAGVTMLVVLGKEAFVKDEVAKDVQFEQKKIESKKEDLKDLESLEKDLE